MRCHTQVKEQTKAVHKGESITDKFDHGEFSGAIAHCESRGIAVAVAMKRHCVV